MTQQATPLGTDPLDADPFDDSRMGLLEHLAELRNRMIWIVGSRCFSVLWLALPLSNRSLPL